MIPSSVLGGLFFLLLLCCSVSGLSFPNGACPCQNVSACETLPLHNFPSSRPLKYFYYAEANDDESWRGFDWTENGLSDLVLSPDWDLVHGLSDQLYCYAHEHGVRIHFMSSLNVSVFFNESYGPANIAFLVETLKEFRLDGISADLETPLPSDPKQLKYLLEASNNWYSQLASALKAANPNFSFTAAVYYNLTCTDDSGLNYDWLHVAKTVDQIAVMAYDLRTDNCHAAANAPIDVVSAGLQSYLDAGIPSDKIILLLPWYGYIYNCLPNNESTSDEDNYWPPPHCAIVCGWDPISCSELDYSQILSIHQSGLRNSSVTPILWEESTGAIWFTEKLLNPLEDSLSSPAFQYRQYYFDGPDSIALKVSLARKFQLAGVGAWTAESLDRWNQPEETQTMWDVVRSFNERETREFY